MWEAAMANWAAGRRGVGPGVKRRVLRIMGSPWRLEAVTTGQSQNTHECEFCERQSGNLRRRGGRRSRNDHQSSAWLIALPGVLNVGKRYPLRIYVKVPFFGVRHHLLKGVDEDVARWNSRRTHDCDCRTAQDGGRKCYGRRGALADLDKAG